MSRVLIEIGCEEIPAGYLAAASEALETQVRKGLQDFGDPSLTSYYTPRRLAVLVEGLAAEMPAVEEDVVGPPEHIAWKDGQPTPALVGFCRKAGVDPAAVQAREIGGQVKAVATVTRPARGVEKELVAHLENWISAIPFPKTMVWNSSGFRFARPIRWLVVLLDYTVVPCAVAGLDSANVTYVHRQADEVVRPVTIDTWLQVLRENGVEPDPAVRLSRIREGIAEICRAQGFDEKDTENYGGLVRELANLVENPVPLTGSFDASYLALPPEVLAAPMVKHQRYMPLVKDGAMTNTFMFVSNALGGDETLISEGNGRVLRARLADALFFWEEDRKRSLIERLPTLKEVIYHASLGSYGEKLFVQQALVPVVAAVLQVDAEQLARAVQLQYADLASQMVYEFPELAGIMGQYYASNDGEDEAVVVALSDGQKPRAAGDDLPDTALGKALSLLSRIETIAGFFAADQKPTGSKDPYALRRAAIAICRLAAEADVDIETIVTTAVGAWLQEAPSLTQPVGRVESDLGEFFATRWEKELARDAQFTTEALRAATARLPFQPGAAMHRAAWLAGLQRDGALATMLDTYKRANNILEKAAKDGLEIEAERDQSVYTRASETRLLEAAHTFRQHTGPEPLAALQDIGAALAGYFDDVLVNDPDETVRRRNLALIKVVRDALDSWADFKAMIY